MDWIHYKYKHRIKQKQIWRINFKYIQNINIEFEFEDILNLSSVYSKFIVWIYKPMATLRAMCRRPKSWDHHIWKVGDCWRESGGGIRHFLHGVWRYPNESKIIENGPYWMTGQLVSIRQKTWNTNYLTSTTAQPFRKRFCGAFLWSVRVSERV